MAIYKDRANSKMELRQGHYSIIDFMFLKNVGP